MSYTFTKLSEVNTIDSLDKDYYIFSEKEDEIKKFSGKIEMFSYDNGKLTEYGYLTKSKNKPYEDENGSSQYYFSCFDLEGNEVDNVDVVKAFNQGVVRCTVYDWVGFGRFIMSNYYIQDGKLYINNYYCLGDIDISNDEIYNLPEEPNDYFYNTNEE